MATLLLLLAVGLVLVVAFRGTGRRRQVASDVVCDFGGGDVLRLHHLCSGLFVGGSTGSGKSYSTEPIIEACIRAGCPVAGIAVKPDEAERYIRMARNAGASNRLRLVAPGSGFYVNLLGYLLDSPGGSPQKAAQFLSRLNEVALRTEGGGGKEEAFWANLFDQAILQGTELCLLADWTANIPDVYEVIVTGPKSNKEAASDKFLTKRGCGEKIAKANANRKPENERRFKRVVDFWMSEWPSLGMRARGAAVSMVNGLLSKFMAEPFYEALCTNTTLTPEQIERERLVVLFAYDMLTYGSPGRFFNLVWTSLIQDYCLRRDASKLAVPFVLVRDEAGYALCSSHDLQVQIVARSQKLAHISLVQDLHVLQAALGGSEKAKHEAMGWIAAHANKLFFSCGDVESAEMYSKLLGDHRVMMFGGSSEGGQPQGFIDELLGVKGGFSWHEQWQPWLRPADFSKLDTAQAVAYLGARTLSNGRKFKVHDFWRGT